MPRTHEYWMRQAISLAKRAQGLTSPNPTVGAIVVLNDKIIGRGYHHAAGQPHAEIEALNHARQLGNSTQNATLYVTLEPCSTHGRTPPCTQAIINHRIRHVVTGAIDPNPQHQGRGITQLQSAGIQVTPNVLEQKCTQLNLAFNHWIIHQTPRVTLKAAMTLDGKIADAHGRSKWITGPLARKYSMQLRLTHDAILVGIETLLADNPSLTIRPQHPNKKLRRIILDSQARTPASSNIVSQNSDLLTTIVTTRKAPKSRIEQLRKLCTVWIAPTPNNRIPLPWLLKKLGQENITSLLVEGGGKIHASFLKSKLAHQIAFFYAPLILGDPNARPAINITPPPSLNHATRLSHPQWKQLGSDLLLTASLM